MDKNIHDRAVGCDGKGRMWELRKDKTDNTWFWMRAGEKKFKTVEECKDDAVKNGFDKDFPLWLVE